MPKDTKAGMTLAEAKRRKAIAEMIIAEIQVGEALHSGSIGPFLGGYPAEGMVWHHNHGWLHPRKYIEAAKADIEAGETTREEVADALGIDVAEVDAENARDRARIQLGDAIFYDCRLQSNLADGTAQDQVAPGTWTTLPQGFDVDADPGYSFVGDVEEYAPDSNPFEITDADEPVTAGIDTQASADGKVRIDITVGGKTLTVDGHESLLEALSRLNRKS